MSGIFGDLDVASAEDNPWLIPANTYEAYLFEVAVKDTKDGQNKGLMLNYKISSGEHKDKTVSEWKNIPNPADPKNPTADEKKAASYIKLRLASLGVPESRMNTVLPEDLIGTPVVIKVVVNGEFTNVSKVDLRKEGEDAKEFKGFEG